MNKISAVRATVECGLSGGCIAGGVECSKMKGVVESSSEKSKVLEKTNEALENQNKTLNETNRRVNATSDWYKKENEKLKNAIKYSAEWLHKLGTMDWDERQLKNNALDAKWGLKNNHLDKQGVDSTFHRWT